ncbi:iron-containing alcohol dehydrogenase [Govanella unica]|uniref:Alcohol dehydrogenase 2 n=1 Tax=Govanella unica TaxID=2975056 RepID=A0A9X3U0B8_9PROT|nr:iron-containing alcohol dehydrogenase [Govania unica]MDA5195058.1 iron-containing alcohol dehydrogenase [Govania unica]
MSASFTFETVPLIQSEPGGSATLGATLRTRFGIRRLLIVTDPGIIRVGLLDHVLPGLEAAGIAVAIFDRVVADPPEAIVLDCVAAARAHEADGVLGFGGGSSLDTAKIAAVLARSGQSLSDIYGVGNVSGGRLPLVLAPTTAGTGSEVTPIAIVTTGETTKTGIVDPTLYADLALLDADLTLGLPAAVTAATGIDAMVHAIEAYTSRIKKNPLSDALAREALALLAGNIGTACADGRDRGARANMLLGAMLAGQAFANAPVGAVHALAYPIGGIFHVPHGLSNALVLPHVLRFNLSEAAPLYAELAAVIVPEISGSVEARAMGFVARLEQLAAAVGIERRLREVGISHNDLPRLAEDAMKQTRLLVNNPRQLGYDDALAIYESAY